MKDVQCYELFGGIALKNHAFSFSKTSTNYNTQQHKNVLAARYATSKNSVTSSKDSINP